MTNPRAVAAAPLLRHRIPSPRRVSLALTLLSLAGCDDAAPGAQADAGVDVASPTDTTSPVGVPPPERFVVLNDTPSRSDFEGDLRGTQRAWLRSDLERAHARHPQGREVTGRRGTRYVVTGGAGASLTGGGDRALRPWGAYFESALHYVGVHATMTRLEVTPRRLDGTVIEAGRVSLAPRAP